jgi:hypothetical protein
MPRASLACLACVSGVVLLLVVRGAADWSHEFTMLWYGMLIATPILGIWSLAYAFDTHLAAGHRLAAGLIGAAALAIPAALVLLILAVLSSVS